MNADEVRSQFEVFADRAVEAAVASKRPNDADWDLRKYYRALNPDERDVVDELLAEWLFSDDQQRNYSARVLISTERITSAIPALRELANRLEHSNEAGAMARWKMVNEILGELTGPMQVPVNADEVRSKFEAFADQAVRSAVASKSPNYADRELRRYYRALDPEERDVLNKLLSEWLLSSDEDRSLSALALIRTERITSAIPALRERANRLEHSDEAGALAKWEMVNEVLGKLTGPTQVE